MRWQVPLAAKASAAAGTGTCYPTPDERNRCPPAPHAAGAHRAACPMVFATEPGPSAFRALPPCRQDLHRISNKDFT